VQYQHRYYLPLALAMNVSLPLLLGWANGDILGMLLLAGVLRLVISHHVFHQFARAYLGLAADAPASPNRLCIWGSRFARTVGKDGAPISEARASPSTIAIQEKRDHKNGNN
jgi:hypothetical protein